MGSEGMVDEEEREDSGGEAECGGGVVEGSGDAVNGLAIEVENGAVGASNGVAIEVENGFATEFENGAVDALNGSTIEVGNRAVDAVNGSAIEVENGFAIEVENGAVDASNGFTIEVENRAVDAMNGLATKVENGFSTEVENGAVDALNGLAIDVEKGFASKVENGVAMEVENGSVDASNGLAMEVETGAVDAANGVATEVENGAVDASNKVATEVEKGVDDASDKVAIEVENGAVDASNKVAIEVENGAVGDGNSVGSSCDGLRTYKRRRRTNMGSLETKLRENGKVAVDSVSQFGNKSVDEPMNSVQHDSSCERLSRPSMVAHTAMNLDDCPLNSWRRIVLEQMSQSLCKSEGGLQGCIQHALLFPQESSWTTAAKGSVHSCDENNKCSSRTGWIANGTHDASRGTVNVMPNGSPNESNRTNADMCRHAFFDVLVSEKFAELCGLLLENFQGIKVDSFFDASVINSRMRDGAYESSPHLFHSDVQQLWTKLQKVGAEMVDLGKSLSDKSRTSYHEQFLSGESDSDNKREKTEACGVYKVCACRCCGDKADGRDCLVCDSCEEMYHVSCIEPAVEEIPSKSWYCAKCTANGIESPHDDCVLCEKLNASRHLENGIEENSNGLSKHEVQLLKGGKTFHQCNVCRSYVDSGHSFRVCGHPFCLHKYYHVNCLTSKQLSTYGSHWYCPSCLCRGCLTDRDDEKIVLCDGCDHAYHIYCMQPPRNTVPKGKWFCRKCDVGIQRIRKAKRAYENLQNKLKKRGEDGKGLIERVEKERKESEEVIDKSGGVDMLLTAARTLNFEEKMAGRT